MTFYTDSKSLYDALTGIQITTEKRLIINLTILRQAYQLCEIAKIVWIPSTDNAADAMKRKRRRQLR